MSVSIITGVIQPPDWSELALCVETDPEAFYPDQGESAMPAKRICRLCPVIDQCRDYAFEHKERFGVWGGLTARERLRQERSAG